jgi:hypothetical protein
MKSTWIKRNLCIVKLSDLSVQHPLLGVYCVSVAALRLYRAVHNVSVHIFVYNLIPNCKQLRAGISRFSHGQFSHVTVN